MEAQKIVDQIQIYNRPIGLTAPVLLYDNHLKNGQWVLSTLVERALTESRDRLWTSEEQDAFLAVVQTVAGQMRQRGASQTDIETFYRYVECPF